MRRAFTLAALLAATQAQAATGNGISSAKFGETTPELALAKVAAACAAREWVVVDRTPVQTTCEGKPDPFTVLKILSTRTLRADRGVARFTVVSVDGPVIIQAFAYTEVANSFGGMRNMPFEYNVEVDAILTAAGGEVVKK